MRLRFAGLLCISLLLNGCERPGEKLPPISEDQRPPPAPVMASVPTAEETAEVAKHSGGLGLSPEAFNLRMGGRLVDCSEISTDPRLCLGKMANGDRELSISAKGNIKNISYSIGPGQWLIAPIRQRLQAYLPADVKLLETYSYEFDGEPGLDMDERQNSIVDIYHSDWLATRFSAAQWREVGVPGRFHIDYRRNVIEIGNGPQRSGIMRDRY